MKYLNSGRILYEVRFLDRPDRDSESFESDEPLARGHEFNLPNGETERWRVSDIVPAAEGEPDTLVCVKV